MNPSDPKSTSVTPLEIERVVARVRAGSVEDYAAIVAAFHDRLRGTLAMRCPPGIDPGEIAHLAFIEAYRQLDRFQFGTNFFAWLCAIARYRLMTECEVVRRQAKNQHRYLDQIIAQQLLSAVQAQGELDDSRLELLNECLRTLNPKAAALIEQRYGARRGVEEMAQALGRTASAISVQLFELRRKLRDCVERKWRLLGAAQ